MSIWRAINTWDQLLLSARNDLNVSFDQLFESIFADINHNRHKQVLGGIYRVPYTHGHIKRYYSIRTSIMTLWLVHIRIIIISILKDTPKLVIYFIPLFLCDFCHKWHYQYALLPIQVHWLIIFI